MLKNLIKPCIERALSSYTNSYMRQFHRETRPIFGLNRPITTTFSIINLLYRLVSR